MSLLRRAILHQSNAAAARTAKMEKSSQPKKNIVVLRFPTTGWIYDSSPFPLVTSTTKLGHLLESRKAASVGSSAVETDIVMVRRPHDGAEAMFFGGYAHAHSWSGSDCYVLVLRWATQKEVAGIQGTSCHSPS